MEKLVADHLRAEGAGDPDGAVANYTHDIEHDVVGYPTGPVTGIPAALNFYRQLVQDFRTDDEQRLHTYYADNACVIENSMTGVVTGQMLGIPGNGKRISFRILHVFEFRDGRISRENVWSDSAAIAAQLTG
ncbi:ester cyclase [Rhodococcus opacus]|nr:ester cyclase [Rhodococcus opacus]